MSSQKFSVRPGFFVHRGKSVHRAGAVLTLNADEQKAHAHQIEPWPLSREIIASRIPAVADLTLRDYAVRHRMIVVRKNEFNEEIRCEGGDIISLTPAEAVLHGAQIELAENHHPLRAPEPEDTTTSAYKVRPGFYCEWEKEVRHGGAVLHLTKRQAAYIGHMIEPHENLPATPIEVVVSAAKRAIRRTGSVPATAA